VSALTPPMPDIHFTISHVQNGRLSPDQRAQMDAIFFQASARVFSSGSERDAFRERWLGRYLRGGTDVVLIALDAAQAVVGYLVGALEDPAEQARFADLPYFTADFRDLCRLYPAHLHVNLAPQARGIGMGAQLVDAFAAHASWAGAPGMHVVTGEQARNVRFYTRCGFAPLRSASWNGGRIVFLGRRSLPLPPA
jgi:GNAT superfamily N-acetyltransferase